VTDLFKKDPCPLCAVPDNAIVYPIDKEYAAEMSGLEEVRGVNLGVAACSVCHHQFISPTPQGEFLSRFYAAYMSSAKTGFYSARYADSIPASFRDHYSPWLKQLRSFSGNSSLRLLDVGSGLGMFLRLAKEFDFSVHGLEPNKEATEYLKKHYQISSHNTLLEDYHGDECFDVISMWDLLEHLANPKLAIRKIHSMLTPFRVSRVGDSSAG